MTNEHLNTQLYWKLHREQEAFKNWLMTQPPAVIIENAYKYAMMEDVLLTFENRQRQAIFFQHPGSKRVHNSTPL